MPGLVITVSGEVLLDAGEIIEADWPLPVSDDYRCSGRPRATVGSPRQRRQPTWLSDLHQDARSPSGVHRS